MAITESALQAKVAAGAVDFTVHAVFEAADDYLFVDEIEHALSVSEIIEDDESRWRCLVCGKLADGGLVHVVLDYADWLNDPESHLAVITVYRPDPRLWIDGRVRRT